MLRSKQSESTYRDMRPSFPRCSAQEIVQRISTRLNLDSLSPFNRALEQTIEAVSLPRDPLWSHFHHLVHYLDVVLSKRFRLVRLQVGIEAGSALRGRPERREHPGIARPGEECSNVRQERRGRDQCVNHEGSLVERSVGLLLHEQLNCLAQERKPPGLPAQGHVSTMRWASRMLTGPLNDRLPPARPAG
jgi:hypothetical protein